MKSFVARTLGLTNVKTKGQKYMDVDLSNLKRVVCCVLEEVVVRDHAGRKGEGSADSCLAAVNISTTNICGRRHGGESALSHNLKSQFAKPS